MRLVVLLLCLAVTGCITQPGPVIDKELDALTGQPASAAFGRLGYPSNEGKVAGEKFYIWSTSNTAWFPSSSTTTGSGMVGGTPFNYNQTTFGGDGETLNLRCTIRVFVDNDERITHHDVNGNVGGCSHYANRLKKSASSFAAKFPQANEQTRVAMEECRNKRLKGELKTHVESIECSNPRMIKAYRDAGYPYMDIIELIAAKRIELAKEVDSKKITEAQEGKAAHDFGLLMDKKERERDENP